MRINDRELREMKQDIDAQWLQRASSKYMYGVNETLKAAGVLQYRVASLDPPKGVEGLKFEHHQFPHPEYDAKALGAENLFYAFALFMDAVLLRRIESIALLVWRTPPEICAARDFDTYNMDYAIYCRVSVWLNKGEEL